MRILVTGGAGFIGGHIAEHFVRGGHKVTVLDTLEPFYDIGIKKHNIELAREIANENSASYEFVEGSITNRDLVSKLLTESEFVFHNAAQAGVRQSVELPNKVHKINITGTLNILDAARDTDIKRIVNASSSSVYGKPKYLPYDEEHPTKPVSPYGVTKVSAEHYARVYHEVYGLPTVSLRYFTVYGPRMRPNMAFTNFVSRCVHKNPPIIYGDGQQTRDFTYVKDIVQANEATLSADITGGEAINIGSGDRISVQELAEVIRDEISPELEIKYESARAGDAEHTHANIQKAEKVLDYEPSVTIKQGAREFIQWYENNLDWYDQLVQKS